MQKKLSSKKFSRPKKQFLFSLILIPIFFGLFYFLDTYFRVRNIEVVGVKNQDALKGLYSWNDKSILLISEKEAEDSLKNSNPYVKSINVYKKLPNTLQIIVSTYKPVIYFEVDEGYLLVSEDGRVLGKSKNKTLLLPVIHYYQKLKYSLWQSGDLLQYKDVISALHFFREATNLGLEINTIDINGTNMIALHLIDRIIMMTTDKEQSIQDYQLESIIRQFKISGKDFAVLDLRFDKPIIQFK